MSDLKAPKGADMTTHKNIAAALAAAQKEMSGAQKTATNPHFKSKYADLQSVMDACMGPLNSHGIAVVQTFERDEHGQVMATKFIHGGSGESVSCAIPIIVQKNDMQGLGSAITYARRYGLMSLAGIAPEDDDGNAAAKAAPATVTPEQFITLRDRAEEAGVSSDKLCGAYGAPSLEQFPANAFARAMTRLNATIEKARKNEPEQEASAPKLDDEIPY